MKYDEQTKAHPWMRFLCPSLGAKLFAIMAEEVSAPMHGISTPHYYMSFGDEERLIAAGPASVRQHRIMNCNTQGRGHRRP